MIFKFGKRKKMTQTVEQAKPVSDEEDSVLRTERFFCYFVYCDKDDKIIDSIYLTESQAQQLNKLLLETSKNDQSLTLMRLIRR